MTTTGNSPPLVAITQGDPLGVGPEIIAKAWPSIFGDVTSRAEDPPIRPVVVGHPVMLQRAIELIKGRITVEVIEDPSEAAPAAERMPCLAVGEDDILEAPRATIDARGGEAAYQAVVRAARLAMDTDIDAMATAPLHKESLHRAGRDYPGHTELLAELCCVSNFAMMLYLAGRGGPSPSRGLAVAHVTLHTSMRNALEQITEATVLAKIVLLGTFLRRLGYPSPRLGVCALNPHAGEGGLFGDEEQRVIRPAIDQAVGQGWDVAGPFPADTIMVRARDGQFDGVVAMYHEQGHIALKLMDMDRSVNITLGLPIIRTSVAHGTALDKAWTGTARCESMVEAIRVAARLARPHHY